MDTLIFSPLRHDGFYVRKPKNWPGAEPLPGIFARGEQWDLKPDSVHFSGGPNRAQQAARLKNKQRRTVALQKAEKLRDDAYDIENAITDLYDQGLNKKDRLAFQEEIISILKEHPDFPIDNKIRPDLAIKRDPGNPLLHFAVANEYWVLASEILSRKPDLCQKDSFGNRAAKVLSDVMAERNDDPPESEDRLAMEIFVEDFRNYRAEHAKAHPDKVNEIYQDEIDNTSGRIVLKGFAEKELEAFVEDGDSAVPEPKETAPKTQTQKQKQALKRQRQAQKQTEKRSAEAERRVEEQNRKLEKNSLAAKQQAEALAQLEIEEQEFRKAEELNRRLDAIPEMTISEEWLKAKTDEPQTEWQTVQHSVKKASPSKPTGTSGQSITSTHRKQHVNKATATKHGKRQAHAHSQTLSEPSRSKAPTTTAEVKLQPGNSPSSPRSLKDASAPSDSPWKLPERSAAIAMPATLAGLSSHAVVPDASVLHSSKIKKDGEKEGINQRNVEPEFCLSPQPLSSEDSFGPTVEEFLLDGDKSVDAQSAHGGQSIKVSLPDPGQYRAAGSSLGSILSAQNPHHPSQPTRRSSTAQTSIASAASNQSLTAKITCLKKERNEKQQLLNEASAFFSRERHVSDEMRQRLQHATTALMEKSSELEQAQRLHWQRLFELGQDAFYWRNQAEQNAWLLQMQTEDHNRYVNQQEALNSLRGAFNVLRQRVANLQEERKQESSKTQQAKDLQSDRLKHEETAIADLEKLQGQIQQREVEAKDAATWAGFRLSTNPDDYLPCSSGLGYRLKEGIPGQGSWVYEIPKG